MLASVTICHFFIFLNFKNKNNCMIEICNVHRFLPYYICEDQLPPTIVHLRAESEVISQQAGVAAVVSRRRAPVKR